jgi:hypothetical protein
MVQTLLAAFMVVHSTTQVLLGSNTTILVAVPAYALHMTGNVAGLSS